MDACARLQNAQIHTYVYIYIIYGIIDLPDYIYMTHTYSIIIIIYYFLSVCYIILYCLPPPFIKYTIYRMSSICRSRRQRTWYIYSINISASCSAKQINRRTLKYFLNSILFRVVCRYSRMLSH